MKFSMTINKKAEAVLKILLSKLNKDGYAKIDAGVGFMPVIVECHSEITAKDKIFKVVSVSHYYEQNGDLIPDPDMLFYYNEEYGAVPVHFQDSMRYKEVLEVREGKIFGNTKGIVALVEFTNMWFNNIKSQQRL